MTAPINAPRTPPYKLAGVGLLVVLLVIFVVVYGQFRGSFTPKTKLTMLASRAGLVMDPGSKVTYNGVQVGRVATISEIERDGKPAAKFVLDVEPHYVSLIPANVNADIKATTVFGGKYVSLTTPEHPSSQKITPHTEIDARSVTTEINTLFATLTSISDKVDPVKLNLTLSAAGQALSGLGDKFGQSIVNGNAILDELNPQMPQIRHDIQQLAALGDTYADAAPDLVEFLNSAVITARTFNKQQKDLDTALLAAAGFGNNAADVFERGGPYLARGAADLVPTAQLLDTYSPELFCTIRNYHDIEPKAAAFLGGSNGYSLRTQSEVLSGAGLLLNPVGGAAVIGGGLLATGIMQAVGLAAGPAGAVLAPASLFPALGQLVGLLGGSANPYIYPDNLPRVNARGGPGGAPGCWQPITHDLWPAPELVMDTGNSIAPYNHLDTASPLALEFVWGRQLGDNTINP